MENKYLNYNGLFYGTLIAIINGILQTVGDLNVISDPESKKVYLLVRVFFILNFLGVFLKIFISKNAMVNDGLYLFINLMLYSIFSQFYNPSYFISYIQVILIFTLFFPFKSKIYYSTLILSTIGMVIAINHSDAFYPNIAKFKQDIASSVIVISIFAFFGYRFITLERNKKDLLSRKFLDIGKNTASIVHDLKGVILSPTIYINLLEKKIKEDKFNELLPLVQMLKAENSYMTEYVQNLNNLSKLSETGTSKIEVKVTIDSLLKTLFKSRLNNISVDIEGSGEIYGDEQSFRSVIINLLFNSIENFEIKNLNDPKINIKVDNQKIYFVDNGGGFSDEAIKSLKKRKFYTEKDKGTGLGLFVVRNCMEEQGGKSLFYNYENKAVVELIFDKKYLKKEVA